MYEFISCGDYYYCKEFVMAEPDWDYENKGMYQTKYYWTIDLKVGYNFYWLPVALPFKSMSMLYMKSFGGMLSIVSNNTADSFPDVIFPSLPISPEIPDPSSNVTDKWRFQINLLTNTMTHKTYNFTHIWFWHGFYNVSLTDLNSFQREYYEMTILPGKMKYLRIEHIYFIQIIWMQSDLVNKFLIKRCWDAEIIWVGKKIMDS